MSPRSTARRILPFAMLSLAALGGCEVFRGPSQTARPGTSAASMSGLRSPERVAVESILRGRRLQEQGLDKQALAEFERAIENNPLLSTAHMAAGDLYMRQGDFEMAAKRYGTAAELAPASFDAQFKFGEALQSLGQLVESVAAYLKALAIRPNDFKANSNVATAYLQLGKPEQALPYAEKAVKLNPRDGGARTNLGAIYAGMGRHEDAVTEYLQANELLPPSPQLLLNLADSLQKAGQFEQAANTIDQLVRIEPSAVAYERLGTIKFRMKQYDESEAAFRKALEQDANHFPAMNGAAVCLLNKYLWDNNDEARLEAIKFLRRSLQIRADQPRIKDLADKYRVSR